MSTGNGYYQDIKKIKEDVSEIKDDLSGSIDRLTVAVNALTTKFDTWIHVAEHSVPLKAVFWMFIILVLAMTGVEGLQALLRFYTGKL